MQCIPARLRLREPTLGAFAFERFYTLFLQLFHREFLSFIFYSEAKLHNLTKLTHSLVPVHGLSPEPSIVNIKS